MCLKSPVNDEGKSLTVYSKIYIDIKLVNDENVKPKKSDGKVQGEGLGRLNRSWFPKTEHLKDRSK